MAKERALWKDRLGRPAVDRIARTIAATEPSFASREFTRSAMRGLHRLELKDRVKHVIGALHRHLPADYPDALAVLVRAGAAWEIGERDDDPYGFAAWPVIDFVGKHGLSHPRESLDALRRLTPLFSAEFAIRPFLVHHEALTMTRLRKWTRDGDEHVRRLVSEGTRPRLPWGERLAKLQRDPTPVLRLLERLKDDRAEYVRRSVANNLNDISKDHPQVVVDVARSWSRGASDERRRIIRHATRTLVKSGHPGALAVLGFDPRARVSVADLSVTPKRLTLGGSLAIRFVLRSRARTAQPLVVDYAVHHVKKSGERKAKVFKLKVLELGAGDRVTIEKRHAIRQISTRQYHSGRHAVDILVNGRACARAEFDLRV